MELSEKELIEKTKKIQMENLFIKGTYIDLYIQGTWRQAYIIDMKPNNKYDIIYLSNQEQMKRKNDVAFSLLSIIGDNTRTSENIIRNRCLNNEIFQMDIEKVIDLLKQKINEFHIDLIEYKIISVKNNSDENKDDKNSKEIEDNIYIGYNIHQFLSGIFIDCLAYIYNEIDSDKPDQVFDGLILLCLDIIICILEIIKKNLSKIKVFVNNRKLLLLDEIYAILGSFEYILSNITFMFLDNFSKNEKILEKQTKIINFCYKLILDNTNNFNIPIPLLVKLIQFITMNNYTKKSIVKFQQTAVFQTYLKSIENLTELEIKNIKKLNEVKIYSHLVIKGLFNQNNPKLINQCYFSAILLCLKCNILEKKIAALNCINEIIEEKGFNQYFYEFLIEKNKILDIFFEESIHDEVIKRSNDLFKYLAKYDKLDEDIIEKLMQGGDNKEIYKNIIIDVISEIPLDKKNNIFEKITKKLNFNENSNDIDYLLKLVEACLIKFKPDKKNKDKKNKEEEKEKEKEIEKEKNYNIGLNGLNLLFNYIIKDFDIKKPYDKNNVDKAIEVFNKVKYLKSNDILSFIEKSFENIKVDETHNSVIQSMMLIKQLINNLNDNNEDNNKNIYEILDKKYQIFNLIINDLIRFINILIDKKETPQQNKIYEGIYPYNINIEQRFEFIFFFVRENGLKLDSKEHLEKIYSLLKNPLFNKELMIFFKIFMRKMKNISNETLNNFLNNIIQNKNEFDIVNFSNQDILNLIDKIFLKINKDEKILYYDSKKVRVKKDNIKKLDLLFDILISNKNVQIQNKVCETLNGLCLNLLDYKTDFCQKYWKKYIDKITSLFENLQKEKNYEGLNGIVKLIDLIYSSSCNYGGKIPRKEDTHQAKEPYELFHFYYPQKKKKYKIRAGKIDKILQMRWKLGYYYDIPINNLVFEDIDKKRYTFKDDETNFYEIFPPEIYCPEGEKDFVSINVYSVPDLFLEIEGNPKELIENNEIIVNNLIQNLYIKELSNDEIRQKIWNILYKLPKHIFINNEIKKYGEENIIEENYLKKIFNIKEIYIFTYTLKCLKEYINETEKEKQKIILNNFINIHHGDELLYNILLDINMDSNDCKLIDYECLSLLIDLIKLIENHKKENNIDEKILKKINADKLLNKISLIIIDLLHIKYDLLHKNSHYNHFDIIDNINDDQKNNVNFITKKINKLTFDLLENILNLTEQNIEDNNNSYMTYLFNNQDLFKKIFFYDYIKCEREEMRKILKTYLTKHLFQIEDEQYIKNYLEIMLSIKTFNELVDNDVSGSYFKELSYLMEKYKKKNKEKKNENEIDQKHYEQFTQIIDLVINYIQSQCESVGYFKNFEVDKTNDEKNEISNDSKIEGLLMFLQNILILAPNQLVNYLINKIDIYDLFLIKSILRKCNKNPLDTKKMLCVSDNSKEVMFELIIFILRNLPEEKKNLEIKIWDELDNLHKIGFWKTNKNSDWKLEPKEIYQKKYIGLKNMTSTCYMNSIIQQLFMIPMLRETILSIENPYNNTVLYQLQLLFSALKTYEYKYYNPKPFVITSGLSFYEQMDADEYYSQLIDKIESDIKSIYTNKNVECPYKDLFKFFFGIKVLDELKFVDCGHKRYNEFYYNNIQLEIKGCGNIEESLKNYCKIEIMDGDNKINCEVCNTKRTCHKRQIFKSLPNILVIVLKRFEFDYDSMLKIKLNDYLEFPFELNMEKYLIEDHTETNTIYELTGITIHDGVADFGHYYDFIKGPDGKWFKFNDTTVKKFNKDDIPSESYGDKNIEEEINKDEESETDKNNAYILIYTKKNFDKEKIENLENNFMTKLALPPYNKFSNINEKYKSIVNCHMYKYWVLENITNPLYQEFVVNLLKIDLAKNYDKNIEANHLELFKELKDEEYIIKNNKDDINKENVESKKDNKIFEYGLRYYFNIMLRTSTKEREYMSKYDEIIKAYIESDSDKSQYILEEFSDNDVINEFLVFCPVEENIKYTTGIIITAFKKYYNDKNKKDKTLLFKFINSLLFFICYNIEYVNLEYVFALLNQLININKDKVFIKYLKEKNIELWISSFEKEVITEEDEANNDLIMSEDNLPVLRSNHYILTEKMKLEDPSEVNESKRDSDFSISNEKRLKDIDINFRLIRKIGYELYKEK